MKVNSKTKIGAIIAENEASIEAIASINSNFKKLKNPVLRKLLAGRVDVATAAKIGGVTTDAFLKVLSDIGFEVNKVNETAVVMSEANHIAQQQKDKSIELDVRPILDGGVDPFKAIIAKLKEMQAGEVLKIINTFKPVPLIGVLGEKGYLIEVEQLEDNLFWTFILIPSSETDIENINKNDANLNNFDSVHKMFEGKTRTIDVRHLEMPEPMVTILNELSSLPEDHCLFVHHKKVPQFLLPELKTRGFLHVEKTIDEGDVKMIILKNPVK